MNETATLGHVMSSDLSSATSLQLSGPVLPRAQAVIRLQAVQRDGISYFKERYSFQPYRLLVPRPADGEPLTAVFANLSGGMLNGDHYQADVLVAEGAEALVMGQAAEKLYKAADPRPIRVENTLRVAANGCLEWLPQGSIQFDAARLKRDTHIQTTSQSTLLAGEILHFGRAAMGEVLSTGLIQDAWTVSVDNRLIWQDRLLLNERTWGALSDPACLDGAEATGLLLLSVTDVESLLADLRTFGQQILPSQGVNFGATVINGLLICRWLGHNAQSMRQHFGAVAGYMRNRILDRPAHLPRIWNI